MSDLEQLKDHPTETTHLLPDDVLRCYEIICAANQKLEQELERVGSNGREDYDKDLGRWKVETQKLGNSKLQPRKFAFIGRTGVGKSTAINAILGAPVLSTGADVRVRNKSIFVPISLLTLLPCRACTSVQTEVIYENLPRSEWRASIKFIDYDDWEKTLANMLDDIKSYRDRGSSNTGRGIHEDSEPAMNAWGMLKEVYPHLRALSFPPPEQDIYLLLEHDAVASKLGTEISISGVGFDKLELQLRPYLTSYSNTVAGEPPESSVWHLVDSVRIYGAFEVLASRAVALVDVPGYGDANKTRTNRTEEYLKTAEVVVLVADIKRAVDEQAMCDYLAKFLRTMIRVDGSMESLLVVLTGADVLIHEDQLHHLDAQQRRVIQEMSQTINRLSNSLKELEDTSKTATDRYDITAFQKLVTNQQKRAEITDQLQTQKAAKNTYIAHQRAARVQEVFLHIYRQVYRNISKQDIFAEGPPPLPVFCVGSADFKQLSREDKHIRDPVVFTDPEDTGIPQVCRHIHDFGRKRALADIKAYMHQCDLLCAEVNSFFKLLSIRKDSMSTAHEKTARALKKFKHIVEETCKDSGGIIDDSINDLESVLRDEAKNAAECSLNIIESLGEDCRYQTYRALMRREGEWQSIDLNEQLVCDMLEGTVSSVWHELFNDSWKSELELLINAILLHYRVVIGSIKDETKQLVKNKVATRVQKACDAIQPEDVLNTAKNRYLFAISKMQREFGGSFKGFIRDELEAHYVNVGSEHGKGMFQRMKDMNEEQFSPHNAEKLYSELVDKVMLAIRSAKNQGDRALEETIPRLYAHIERTLICIRQSNKMSNDTRKKMLTFLEEQYSTSLADVRSITDRYEE
ncbi:uncharacterized protein EDB93DRAFT_1329269 [Suillus bovinus]|uniref:uncharacterized protein n=1 Tax=Suillus bovinus TaxID=48563 RepID=UPI001B8751F0|nr:uncharacterized protein EDB93DRAFT_1329269 [Suillus bovinus]KAG2144409.1 hypothetical protein EDB93DRAFT_1329269 [Suillus bovinus]